MSLFHVAILGAVGVLTACQRNAGLIAEASDAPDASSAQEPPAAKDSTQVEDTTCRASEICLEVASPAQAACDRALTTLLASATLTAPASCEVLAEAEASGPEQQRAAILRFRQADFGEPYWVAFGDRAGYRRAIKLMDVSGGVNTTLALRVASLAFEDVVPGGERELRIEMHSVVDDHDCSGEFSWRTERIDVGVCGLGEQEPYCIGPLPQSLRRFETRYDPRSDRESSELSDQYTTALRFEAQALRVWTVSGRTPEQLRPILGRHALPQAAAIVRALPFPN